MRWFTAILFALLIASPAIGHAQECLPELVKYQKVVYPDSAIVNKIEGTVFVQATITTDGSVKVVKVIKSDNEILNEAAMTAVAKYEFKPLAKECKVTIPVKFKLSD